ncbi:MAG: tail fiber protein, partial [Bacteroidota bacterium]
WAPQNWLLCDGIELSIGQYHGLFSVIGTMYGGDGRVTFGLPDMRGRIPIGSGYGIGLTPRRNGDTSGAEHVTLNTLEIPAHNHAAQLTSGTGTVATNLVKGSGRGTSGSYISSDSEFKPNPTTDEITGISSLLTDLQGPVNVGLTGGNRSHPNMQPWLCVSFIICYQGVFPSRR